MYYYKQLDENGNLLYLLTYDQKPNISNPLTVEITKEEYEQIAEDLKLLAETEAPDTTIEEKALAYDILTGESE